MVPDLSTSEVELAIEKLKSHKSPGIDQIPAVLIKAGGRIFRYEIHNLLFLFGIGRNCLMNERSTSLYLSVKRTINQIVVIIGAYHICQLYTKFYPASCSQS